MTLQPGGIPPKKVNFWGPTPQRYEIYEETDYSTVKPSNKNKKN